MKVSALILIFVITFAQAAEFNDVYTWNFKNTNDNFRLETINYSSNDHILLGGTSPGRLGYSIATYSDTLSNAEAFLLSPGGFANCEHFNGGFLGDTANSGFYYLTFVCKNSSTDVYAYFIAQMNLSDKSVKQYLTITIENPPAKFKPTNFPSAFLNSNVVVVIPTSAGQAILGFSGSLKFEFQKTASSAALKIQNLAGQDGSDSFTVVGFISTSETYVATFDTSGDLKEHIIYGVNSSGGATVVMSTSGIQLCTTGNASNFLLLNPTDLTPIKFQVNSHLDGNSTCIPGDSDSFVLASIETEGFPVWIFNAQGEITSSFKSTGFNGDRLFPTTGIVINNGEDILFATGSINTNDTTYDGFVSIGINANGFDFQTPPTSFNAETSPSTLPNSITWTSPPSLSGFKQTTATANFVIAVQVTTQEVPRQENHDDPTNAIHNTVSVFVVLMTMLLLGFPQ